MAKSYPSELANVYDGTANKLGRGDVRETNLVTSRNTFDANTAANPTTTSDVLSLGKLKKGDVPLVFEFNASTNMSAASVAIGTATDPDKYLAAAALPNATSARRVVPFAAAGYAAGADADEELIMTISGATIPTGKLTVITSIARR